VRVNCTLHQGRAKLTIADDGPGIDPSQVELILQRGGRLDQAVPGQGIGLAVVVDIVEAYQGKLSVTHSDLGGAAIALDLPANE
jgi:two-component system sensor histidine kinase PhoQ